MTSKLRVLVVEDSATVRQRLVEAIASDPDLEVVGEVGDGKAAVERCSAIRPDVVTTDRVLPVMTGVAATEHIMAYCPTPILIVSASVNRGELFQTYDALAAGAVDALEKPNGEHVDSEWDRRFVSAIKMAARIRVITHPRARLKLASRPASPFEGTPSERHPSEKSLRAIAIGTSTGGPAALRTLFQRLPENFTHPILLVIHIGESFSSALAEWLNAQSHLGVSYARDGEPLPPVGYGRVLMAPAGKHLVLRDGRLRLTGDPERHYCRPSVDTLFESVAAELGASAGACLLTGMGRDGAQGLLEVRRAGGRTLAQDEASSVIFGMPREAVLLQAAEQVLSLEGIADTLTRWTRPSATRGAP